MRFPTSATSSTGQTVIQLSYAQAVALRDALRRERGGSTLAGRIDAFIIPRSPTSAPFRMTLDAADLSLLSRVAEPLPELVG